MPKIKIEEEQLAVVRVLETLGWSHSRIGRVFDVKHTTVAHALRNRKTTLPQVIDSHSGALIATVLDRIDRASRRAMVRELRVIASELAKDPQPSL